MEQLDTNSIKQNSYNGSVVEITPNTNNQSNDKYTDMPIILSKTIKVLRDIHVNINDKIILNALLAKTFQMISSKHITYNESGRIKIPNWFALMFMQSGGGKDWLVDDLDKFVFSKYHNWYKDEINKFYEKQLKEWESDPKNAKLTPKGLKPQKIVEELQDATQEGLYRLAQLTKNTDFGNIFIKMSEFGLYIKNSGKQEQKFLSAFCQLYDCKIPAKIIKSEGFIEAIENIAINILAYSSFVLFDTDIWTYFSIMLEAGLCRRFQVSFQRKKDKIFVARTDEQVTQHYQALSELSNEYFDIFEKIQHGSCYKLLPEAKTVFNEYCLKNNEEYNKEEIPLCKDEIQSRCQKIIKLACLFGCLNHPQEQEIMFDALENYVLTSGMFVIEQDSLIDIFKIPKENLACAIYRLNRQFRKEFNTKIKLLKFIGTEREIPVYKIADIWNLKKKNIANSNTSNYYLTYY